MANIDVMRPPSTGEKPLIYDLLDSPLLVLLARGDLGWSWLAAIAVRGKLVLLRLMYSQTVATAVNLPAKLAL